jgi:hypothetical protein
MKNHQNRGLQYQNGPMTWMIWAYSHFSKPPYIYIYYISIYTHIYIYIKQLWIQILIVCSDDAFPMMINDAMYTINMNVLMQINFPDASKGLLRLHFTHPGGNGIQKQIPL